jgi:hypothetical protein
VKGPAIVAAAPPAVAANMMFVDFCPLGTSMLLQTELALGTMFCVLFGALQKRMPI